MPAANVPDVRVRVPFTVKSAPMLIFLLTLKLLRPPEMALSVIAVPVPIVRFEVAPPVSDPEP